MARRILLSLSVLLALACGPADSGGDPDPMPDRPCRAERCGPAEFQAALPSRERLMIGFGGGNATRISQPGVVISSLDATSEHLELIDENADGIDELIGDVWDELEWVIGSEPELEEEGETWWRTASEDDPDVELLLVATEDDTGFTFQLYAGPEGIDPESSTEVIRADIDVDSEGEPENLMILIDLDEEASAYGTSTAGAISIEAQLGATTQIFFDLDEVSTEGEAPASSETTFLDLEGGVGVLEHVGVADEVSTHWLANWNATGAGRSDYVAQHEDLELGLLEEIGTNCWDASGGEVFDGFAVFDEAGQWYAEIDGEETSCAFSALENDPTADGDFENLPREGEWESIALESCVIDEDPGCPAPFFIDEE